MAYLLADIDILQPLPTLTLTAGQTGLGLIVRRGSRPVGFVLRPASPGTVCAPEELAQLIAAEAGPQIAEESLREELAAKTPPPSGPPLSLTVAICTKDHPDLVTRCLRSLREMDVPGPDRVSFFEILVIDNAPSDERTRDAVAAFPGVRYAVEPLPGLDFARNRAIAEARGEMVAYIDDDAAADRGWLAGLADAWRENPDAGGFTGLVLPYELETDAQVIFERRGGFQRGFRPIRFGRTLPGSPLYPAGAGLGAGCNMAFRKDVLLALGGFDEALDTGKPLPGGGDLDIFYRVVRAGYPLVYEPRYLVFHQHRRDRRGLRRQYGTWGRGFMAFLVKSHRTDPPGRHKLRHLAAWFFGDQAMRLLIRLRRRSGLPADMIAAELWGGIVGLCGEYGRSCRRVAAIRRGAA